VFHSLSREGYRRKRNGTPAGVFGAELRAGPHHLPHAVENTILGSIGGALGVAARVGGATGHLLAHVARSAFISGADLGLLIEAAVVLVGCVLALLTLPARPRADAGGGRRHRPT
jgi:hypothetical protein